MYCKDQWCVCFGSWSAFPYFATAPAHDASRSLVLELLKEGKSLAVRLKCWASTLSPGLGMTDMRVRKLVFQWTLRVRSAMRHTPSSLLAMDACEDSEQFVSHLELYERMNSV